jgi:hypothetical protein
MPYQAPKTDWAAGNVPAASDFNRIEGNVETLKEDADAHAADYVLQIPYAVATGPANSYAVALDPAPTALVDGLAVAVKINVDNTGPSTLNVNNLGSRPLRKPFGTSIPAGKLKAGSVYTFRYNGTNFILQGSDSSGDVTAAEVLAGKMFSNDIDTEITGTMPDRGSPTLDLGDDILPGRYTGGQVNDSPHGSQVYNAPGSYVFVVPAGVSKIMALVSGGGGGAGTGQSIRGGGGGGGGGNATATVNVTPG